MQNYFYVTPEMSRQSHKTLRQLRGGFKKAYKCFFQNKFQRKSKIKFLLMIIIRFLYDNAHNMDEPANTAIKPLF